MAVRSSAVQDSLGVYVRLCTASDEVTHIREFLSMYRVDEIVVVVRTVRLWS